MSGEPSTWGPRQATNDETHRSLPLPALVEGRQGRLCCFTQEVISWLPRVAGRLYIAPLHLQSYQDELSEPSMDEGGQSVCQRAVCRREVTWYRVLPLDHCSARMDSTSYASLPLYWSKGCKGVRLGPPSAPCGFCFGALCEPAGPAAGPATFPRGLPRSRSRRLCPPWPGSASSSPLPTSTAGPAHEAALSPRPRSAAPPRAGAGGGGAVSRTATGTPDKAGDQQSMGVDHWCIKQQSVGLMAP